MATILIADDDVNVLSVVRIALEEWGYQVMEAHNGLEAARQLGLKPGENPAPKPDLIILDLLMPFMDGLTLLSWMGKEERTKNIPVIVLTGKPGAENLLRSYFNIVAVLNKPVNFKGLQEAIAKALEKTGSR